MTARPPDRTETLPSQVCQVFAAADFTVCAGVNLHEALSVPDDACLGDAYRLRHGAATQRLALQRDTAPPLIAEGSDIGHSQEPVQILGRFVMMAGSGDRVEVLLLRVAAEDYVLPLSPIGGQIDYTLLQSFDQPAQTVLADMLCISFARGTTITLNDGSPRQIEDLRPGDRVLTRDHGGQPLRWVGKTTQRAVGSFAPVVISAGAMGNSGDLIVSQHHRMFLYQRNRQKGITSAEVLVQAKHLVDERAIFLREGGFVEYYSLVFDRHEIIYAEGIPAESLLVTDATVSRLPPDLAAEVSARFPGLRQDQHFGTEATREVLAGLEPGTLYRSGRA
jgi:hypothetical protein